jgi:hypothetical protein
MQQRPVKKRTDQLVREIGFTGRYGGFSNCGFCDSLLCKRISLYQHWGGAQMKASVACQLAAPAARGASCPY